MICCYVKKDIISLSHLTVFKNIKLILNDLNKA